MLDHEEKFLFKEEILHLAGALSDPAVLDNVEDLLTDVITSPRFDSEVFTLERSLQVMLGARAGLDPGRAAHRGARGLRGGRRGPDRRPRSTSASSPGGPASAWRSTTPSTS